MDKGGKDVKEIECVGAGILDQQHAWEGDCQCCPRCRERATATSGEDHISLKLPTRPLANDVFVLRPS